MSIALPSQPVEEQTHSVRKIENVPGRLGSRLPNLLRAGLMPPWHSRLARAALLIPKIRYHEGQCLELSDEELLTRSMELKGKARGQFELATGEGKTVTASLPAYLNALVGKGVHVTTVNDYLAKRDAEWIGPVYEKLGLEVGCLQQKMDDNTRITMYKRDITYGTASEFGFDFLRDRLKVRGGQAQNAPFWAPWLPGAGTARLDPRVQRPLHYAIVDEADSIFVDEAKTPLIIANPTRLAEPDEQVVYLWAERIARAMRRDEHFGLNLKKDKIEITDAGRHMIRYSDPPTGKNAKAMDKLQEAIEKALHAHYRFTRDHHYMINSEKKIIIIDEGTGRPMPDRHWRDGLHQAVEAKENVPINMPSEHAAQITFQNFYRLYTKLCGMSGTLLPNFWELRKVYRGWTTWVPTNRVSKRVVLPDEVYPTEDLKFIAVVKKTLEMLKAGRPVLIGTRTVDASKKLSTKLTLAGVPHKVLNAEQNEHEAEVVSLAGQPGAVTVATNMAGRGTDIKLGEGVAANGGLHVIGTERHEAERIDRQLIGRAGRQGDPGTAQFMVSLEDQLLEGLGTGRQMELRALGQRGGNRNWKAYASLFRIAQQRIERRHYRQRLDLKNFDKQRQEMLKDIGADPYVD
jgi:preprotein translocase subunit SecA